MTLGPRRVVALEHSKANTHCALSLTKTQVFDPKSWRIRGCGGGHCGEPPALFPVPGLAQASPGLAYSDAGTLVPFPFHPRNASDQTVYRL